MTSDMVSEVYRLLHINPTQTFYLNLGNDRPNICQEVRLIRNGHDYAAIDFLFASVTKLEDMERTLIFVNRVEDSQLGWQHSCRLLPTHLQSYVRFLHLRRADSAKVEELAKFQRDKGRILWLTEIGAMVSYSQ